MGEGRVDHDEDHGARARAAVERADWAVAVAAYAAADAAAGLDADDLDAWAIAAYLLGHVDVAVDAGGRAHRLHLDRSDLRAAVRSGFWTAFALLGRGDEAQAGGWLSRCARLTEALPDDAVECGYLLVAEAFRLAAGAQRWDEAHPVAMRAAETGRRASDDDLVALALSLGGRSLLAIGRVDEGLALLDEAMVAVVSAGRSPIVIGTVYCSLIEACEEIADWRRAGEWTDALTRWSDHQHGMVTFTGQCLTHRAQVLRLRGDLPAAADAARAATERFAGASDARRSGAASYEEGEVHRIRGDLASAEAAYARAADHGFDPQPGLALLRLVQVRRAAAVASVRRLDAEWTDVPARIRLLPAYVEVMLADGDLAAARAGAHELSTLAATYGTVALRASAEDAGGAVLLAGGEPEAALARLRRAADTWRSLDAPYEVARTRLLIARACRALGDEDTATREREAAHRALVELGAVVAGPGPSPSAAAPEDHGMTARELEVLRLVATGTTNQTIAVELHVAVKTVDRHVANILAKLGVASRTAATAFAYEHDLVRAPGDG